jgi:hypothetical protein
VASALNRFSSNDAPNRRIFGQSNSGSSSKKRGRHLFQRRLSANICPGFMAYVQRSQRVEGAQPANLDANDLASKPAFVGVINAQNAVDRRPV